MRKLKIRKNYKISRILFIVISLIFFLTLNLIIIYYKKVSPKIINLAEVKLQKFTESFLSNNIGYDILNDENIDNILVINKNEEGEILYVDYNLDQAYLALDVVTNEIYELIRNLEQGKFSDIKDSELEASKNGLILKMPLFISSNYPLLANLGPKIYTKINFVGSILTNIKSQITDYGMNNALVELYVTIKINEELITPVTNEVLETEYDVLIASKVINGRVPAYYGGAIIEKSSLLSIPIEN